MIRRRYPRINGRGLCIIVLLLSPAWLAADEVTWGHLAGRFVWDGPAPRQRTLPVVKDQAVFGDTILDESLLMHAENRGIANVLVYLWPDDGEKLRVHPGYDETARSQVELAMENGRFVPHVLLMRTSQTLIQRNRDDVGHNAHIEFLSSSPLSPALPISNRHEVRYAREERMPVFMRCNVHPWMRGVVLLRSNPYMAKSDVDGRFVIENVPVGPRVFRLWHERAGYLRNIKVGTTDSDARGRLAVTIQEGSNQLGEVLLPPRMFDENR